MPTIVTYLPYQLKLLQTEGLSGTGGPAKSYNIPSLLHFRKFCKVTTVNILLLAICITAILMLLVLGVSHNSITDYAAGFYSCILFVFCNFRADYFQRLST